VSAQTLRIRLPGLLVAVSLEHPRRRRESRPPGKAPAEVGGDRLAQRLPSVTGMEPSLVKLQM
jgi:hypothetical protein